MNISDKGIRFLRQAEGVRPDVYRDSAGLPTIGVGHLLAKSELASGKITIKGVKVKYANGLSNQQIDDLLRQDLVRFVEAVKKYVKVRLNQNQFDALVSFCFNVGRGAFRKSTLLRILNRGGYDAVPIQLKRWVYSGGKKVDGLVNRRNAEISLWKESIPEESFIKLTVGPKGTMAHYESPNGEQTVILTGGWVIS